MTDADLAKLRALADTLSDPDYAPHPRASALVLPDGSAAPEEIRVWAAIDTKYPSALAERRSEQSIADEAGVVLARPMRDVLQDVCVEDVRDEVDDETIAYLGELVDGFAGEFPGFGVRLEPFDLPDKVLWFGPDGAATLLWYENDAIERRERFASWAVELFEEDG